jgi:hypothetical protein
MDTNCLIIHNNKRLKITTSFNQKQMKDYESFSVHMAHFFTKKSRTIKATKKKEREIKSERRALDFPESFVVGNRGVYKQSRAAG